MHSALPADALDQLFRTARTHNEIGGEVSDELLHQLYDLLKWGPTTANSSPARFVFVKSAEAKAKLGPALDEGNYAKTMAAPVTVIVAYDTTFFEKMPYLFPHTDARSWFDSKPQPRSRPSACATAACRAPTCSWPHARWAWIAGRCRASTMPRSTRRSSRHAMEIELPRQPRPWRCGQAVPALAPPRLRRGRAHRLIVRESFRRVARLPSSPHSHGVHHVQTPDPRRRAVPGG
jgi:nitroreductase